MTMIKAAVTAITLAFAGAAFAQTTTPPASNPAATPGIDKRQENQQKRIDAGVKSRSEEHTSELQSH